MSGRSIYDFGSFHHFLEDYFKSEKLRNKPFSYRWLARKIGLKSHTHLIRIAQGKDRPSDEVFEQLARYCGLSTEESLFAKALMSLNFARKTDEIAFCSQKVHELRRQNPATQLAHEAFELISEWHHIAIFEMIDLPDFKNSPGWIANKLGDAVSHDQVASSIEKLIRAGLIIKGESGKISRCSSSYSTTHNIPSAAIRSFHRHLLERAIASLDSEPISRRAFFGHTMPLDSSRIEEAQNLIIEFREKFQAIMSRTGTPDNVYHLAVQLIPLTVAPGTRATNGA